MIIKVILADDHSILRQGLRLLLDDENDIQVIGEANNGIEAIKLVEKLNPDILVIDVMMPEMNGLEAARQIHECCPLVKIIVLSMHAKEAYVMEAIKNGASAYVLKDSQSSDLINAIHNVIIGKRFLSLPLSERLMNKYFNRAEKASDSFEILTTREREVFQMVAEGGTTVDIANIMNNSARTVDVYRANLMRKLSLKNQTDLIRLAIKRGIISEE